MPAGQINIGINGPGMIGRDLVRMFFDFPEFGGKINAINYHAFHPDRIAYLTKYCSIYGPWYEKEVHENDKGLTIEGEQINLYAEEEAENIPWDKQDTQIVIDSSRVYNDPENAKAHFKNSNVKNVIISSSPIKNECPIIVFGVNHTSLDPTQEKILSAATCSSNCLVSTVSVLDKAFGTESLYALTTHSQTGENEIYDRLREGTEGRSISDNVLPAMTGATKTFFKVMPHLKDQLGDRVAIKANRVPVTTGSVFDLNVKVKKSVSVQNVIEAFREAEASNLKGTLAVTIDPITVVDIKGIRHASVIATPYIEVLDNGTVIQLKAFYDNIRGFNSQIGRLVKYISSAA
ncbi:aldehyde dehydrogenase [Candidatus Daviesbacteria bacterium]|nr:aldehyde dehydrogenase [Candidatus Daviesbacteria bacterium]